MKAWRKCDRVYLNSDLFEIVGETVEDLNN